MTMIQIEKNVQTLRSLLDAMIVANPNKTLSNFAADIDISVITLTQFLYNKKRSTRKTMSKIYNYLRKVDNANLSATAPREC
jgi:hypothetical protein